MTWVVVGGAVVVIAVVLLIVARGRRGPDGVTTFQRQIDALSPDARRSVVRTVRDLDARKPGRGTAAERAQGDQPAPLPPTRSAGGGTGRGVVGDPLGGRRGGDVPARDMTADGADGTGANDGT